MKKKVLVTNNHAEYFLGSEKAIYELAEQFLEMGYEVDFFTYLKAEMTKRFEDLGCNIVDYPGIDYEFAVVHHNSTLINIPKEVNKIFVCNGIIPQMEMPIDLADYYVGVSEETKEKIESMGFTADIFRNAVPLWKYKPVKPIKDKPEVALMITNHFNVDDSRFQVLNEACKQRGIRLMPIGLQFGTTQWDITEAINMADIVFTLGRGALESMACGRNVIVAESKIDGYIDKKSYFEIRKNNFSGRRYGKPLSVGGILEEIGKYTTLQGEVNRALIEKHHNIETNAKRYVELNKLINQQREYGRQYTRVF